MSGSGVRGELARRGLLARKDLGQNFLYDEAQAERLASLAGVGPDDTVFEIGAGLGTLTRALAERAARVVSLEVDAGLVRALRESNLPAHVELLHADVLRADLGALVRVAAPPVRVVANLPYSISAPVLRRVLDLRDALADWSVMLQREVADRLLARPGTRSYGSLTVLHALTVSVEQTARLAPHFFYPAPKVRSSFVRIVPLPEPLVRQRELARVERVVRAAFSQRRKTLVNALRGGALDPAPSAEHLQRVLAELGIDPRARAESLDPAQLLAVARALRAPSARELPSA